MPADYSAAFAALKKVFARQSKELNANVDTATEYSLVTKVPSPFPQHKGHPMWFGSVKTGKAYVSFHLMPLYMNADLEKRISPELKKRMQGKTCFNFKDAPEAALLAELEQLAAAGIESWRKKKWA